MQSYICYVHTDANMIPHMRIVSATDQDDFLETMCGLLKEWPMFDMLDVYDLSDHLVLRMAGIHKPTVS